MGPALVPNASVRRFRKALKKTSFDSHRVKALKSWLGRLGSYKLKARQAARLLKVFSFDSNRLKAALALCPYVSDKLNLSYMTNTFSFSSNKKKFLKSCSTGSASDSGADDSAAAGPIEGPRPISASALGRFRRSLKKTSYDSHRVTAVKAWVGRLGKYRLRSKQAARLLKVFSFDSNRLKAALALCPVVMDKLNLSHMVDTFSFSSNKRKLRKLCQ